MRTLLYIFNFKRKKLYNLLKVILFLGILVILLCKATYILSAKDGYIRKNSFYESKVDFEVFLMGTSHMQNGIFPMELYRDFGLSAYNLAVAGERLAMTYWSLVDALQYTTPKLVVIDMHGLGYGDQKVDPEVPRRMHISFDAMRLNSVKWNAITDLTEKESWAEFFFPLTLYHNRWEELSEEDFRNPTMYNVTNGAVFNLGVANAEAPILLSPEDYDKNNNYSTQYLEKIIQLCQSKKIEVMLVYIPFPSSEGAQRCVNQAYELAAKYDISYLNMLYLAEEIGIDYSIDTADKSSHLNPLGAKKVSEFIGKYIVNNYEVSDHRRTTFSEVWQRKYKEYMIYKDNYLKEINDYYFYLMMIADKDYSYSVYFKENTEALNDETIMKLINSAMPKLEFDNKEQPKNGYYFLSNIKGDRKEELGIKEMKETADFYIVVTNNITGELVECSNWRYGIGRE